MNDQEKIALYQELVESKIKKDEFGLIELPISALQEYHDKAGLEPERLCYFGLSLPGAEEGLYDCVIGMGSDPDATVLIMGAFYYDVDTGKSEFLAHNKVLEASIYRRFYEGEALVCGNIMIDQLGRLWMYVMTEDNIGAELCIQMSDNGVGYEICKEDLSFVFRVLFDGKTLLFVPTPVQFSSGLPS